MCPAQSTWQEQNSWMDHYRARLGPPEGYAPSPGRDRPLSLDDPSLQAQQQQQQQGGGPGGSFLTDQHTASSDALRK